MKKLAVVAVLIVVAAVTAVTLAGCPGVTTAIIPNIIAGQGIAVHYPSDTFRGTVQGISGAWVQVKNANGNLVWANLNMADGVELLD